MLARAKIYDINVISLCLGLVIVLCPPQTAFAQKYGENMPLPVSPAPLSDQFITEERLLLGQMKLARSECTIGDETIASLMETERRRNDPSTLRKRVTEKFTSRVNLCSDYRSVLSRLIGFYRRVGRTGSDVDKKTALLYQSRFTEDLIASYEYDLGKLRQFIALDL